MKYIMSKIKFFFLTVIFLFFLLTTTVNADDEIVTIQFVDNNLYQSIKTIASSIIVEYNDANKVVKIPQDSISKVYYLNLSNKNITYLYGIDKFTSLTNLNLTGNNISNLQYLSNLTNLTSLNITENKVSNLTPLVTLKKLTHLYAGYNSINNIDALGKLTSLVAVILEENNIRDITPVSSLQNLSILGLKGNRVEDTSVILSMPNLDSFNLESQKYVYSLNGVALANINTNVNLPTFFLQAKQVGSPIYTDLDFTVTGATIGSTPSYIVLKNDSYGQKVATVQINGGEADGSILTLNYSTVLVTVSPSTSSPEKIYEGEGGNISFVATANGDTSTDNLSIQILKNNINVTNNFNITTSKSANNSLDFNIQVPKDIVSGLYSIYVTYDSKIAVRGNFTIYDKISVSSIALNTQKLSLAPNENSVLRATINPANATNKKIIWSSNNPSVATVDSSGTVSAHSAGTAIITATSEDSGKAASCTVIVSQPVQGVSLNYTNITVKLNESIQLLATINPTNATNKQVIWKSGNEQIASVSPNGLVTGKSVGTTVVTVTTEDGNYTARCKVTVKDVSSEPVVIPVQSITLNKPSISLILGKAEQLVATILPSNATNKQLIWSSENPNIASVDSSGIVTAVGIGSTRIVVTALDDSNGEIKAICNVVVNTNKPTSLKYKLENNYILGISPETNIKNFLSNINIPLSYKIQNNLGEEVSEQNSLVTTGMKIVLEDSSSYTIIVTGDISGDGKLSSSDILMLKRHLVNIHKLDALQLKGADVNNSNSVTLTDLMQLKMATVKLITF